MDRATAEQLQAEINEHVLYRAAVGKDPDGVYYVVVGHFRRLATYSILSRAAWLRLLVEHPSARQASFGSAPEATK